MFSPFFACAAWAGSLVDTPVRTGATASADAALVIGIEDYAFLPDVPYATRDAQVMRDAFLYTLGVPPDRVKMLTQEASKERISRALQDTVALAESGGTVWVYFAGHGAASPATGARVWLGVDTMADVDSFQARAVALDELAATVRDAGRHAVLLTDACYTGRGRDGGELVSGARFAVPTYTRTPADTHVVEWSAASENEWSLPLDAERHGAFTWAVAGALRGWADGQVDGTPDGVITLTEANLFVEEALRLRGLDAQHPRLSAADGNVVLVRAPGRLEARPAELASPVAPPTGPAPAAVGPVATLPSADELARAQVLLDTATAQLGHTTLRVQGPTGGSPGTATAPPPTEDFVGPVPPVVSPCSRDQGAKLGGGWSATDRMAVYKCPKATVFVVKRGPSVPSLEAALQELLGSRTPERCEKGVSCVRPFMVGKHRYDPFDASTWQRGSLPSDVAGTTPWVAVKYEHLLLPIQHLPWTTAAQDPRTGELVGCHGTSTKDQETCVQTIAAFLIARSQLP